MATPFGKAVKKLRIDLGLKLKDMADYLDVKSAYLSAVENGRKKITDNVLNQTIEFFELHNAKSDTELRQYLSDLADQSQPSVTIDLEDKEDEDRELLVAFARRFSDLSNNQKKNLKSIIDME